MKMHNPPHPGLVLREYIEGMKIGEVAQKLGVSRISLSRILNGKTAITPEMATRIGLALTALVCGLVCKLIMIYGKLSKIKLFISRLFMPKAAQFLPVHFLSRHTQ